MNVATHTRVIKVHVVEMTDVDVERLLADPEELSDFLNGLLMVEVKSSNGRGVTDAPVKKKRQLVHQVRRHPDRVECETCGVLIAAYRQGKHKCKGL